MIALILALVLGVAVSAGPQHQAVQAPVAQTVAVAPLQQDAAAAPAPAAEAVPEQPSAAPAPGQAAQEEAKQPSSETVAPVAAKKAATPVKRVRVAQKALVAPEEAPDWEGLSNSPKGKKRPVYIAHFKDMKEAVSGKSGTQVEVVEQGRLNPDELTSPGTDHPVVCRSDAQGHSDGFCVAEEFVVERIGATAKMIEVVDFMSYDAALNGGVAVNHRVIPLNWFNPLRKTASSADVPVTCRYENGRSTRTCVPSAFIEEVA